MNKNRVAYKVLKGKSRSKPKLDSTHTDLSKANARRKALLAGLKGMGVEVWIVAMEDGDMVGHRKVHKHRSH